MLFGFGGDDRLWGDGGPGKGFDTDVDVLFGGQGNDDLIGGQRRNFIFAWSQNPNLGQQFGVFVDPLGELHNDTQKNLHLDDYFAGSDAYDDIEDINRITGLTIAREAHVDRLRFTLPSLGIT